MSLPASGLADEVLARLGEVDPADPNRLSRFVDAVGTPARRAEPPPDPRDQLVSFALGDELFAVAVERVREVVRAEGVTRVPQAPEHVRGVQNLRGRILPVLETRTRVNLPTAEITPSSRVVVVEGRDRLFGLLVDGVQQVASVPRSEIQPPPPEVRTQLSEYVTGLAHLGGRVALLLDLNRLLVLPHPGQDPTP